MARYQMSYNQPSSPLYQRCPDTNMLFAYWPVGPDTTMYSALLGNVYPQRRPSDTDGKTCSLSKPSKERVSARRRIASFFYRRSPNGSPTSPPSRPDSIGNVETLSESKNVSRGVFRRKTTSSESTKSTSSWASKCSTKKAKKNVTFSEGASGSRGQQYLSNAYPSAWSYVVW